MNFIKNDKYFSFKYDGKPAWEYEYEELRDGNETVYLFSDGLKVTSILKRYPEYDACEWVNWFENTSDKPTKIISELWDCDAELVLKHEDPPKDSAYLMDKKKVTKIYSPNGSDWSGNEFYCDVDEMQYADYINYIKVGKTRHYESLEGRSSQGKAPFFNIHKDGEGYVFAVGWTGQWNCDVTRNEDSVIIRSKIEDTNFKLLPGEKIRTSSAVLMAYKGSFIESQNKWRRLVKEKFSLVGASGRDQYGPLCAGIWGGTETKEVLRRLEIIKENDIPVEYIWMDAGWYGINNAPTPDEFEGDWDIHAGDWCVSPKVHPGGLRDVSKAIHDMGKKFLLWFEPERTVKSAPIYTEHPEYFLNLNTHDSTLLNLGDESAWTYCHDMLCDMIETIGIDFYRQDFNINPLEFWRSYDEPDRKGITEIKYIMGLYALWDSMLEKFPHLMIDNCASGGRRIDIEMLRRSIPLWRSDVQCPANFETRLSQMHHQSFNIWMPYSGTGSGRAYDIYRARSTYDSSMTTNYSFSQRDSFGDDPAKNEWIKNMCKEYLRVRPYFCEDYYPLTQTSGCTDVWCASQFDRPSEKDGIIQVFRREDSPYESVNFDLFAIDENAEYSFVDADDDSSFTVSGKELKENGFNVKIGKKYASKIYFYSHR